MINLTHTDLFVKILFYCMYKILLYIYKILPILKLDKPIIMSMKKLLFIFAAALIFCACEKEETYEEKVESFWANSEAITGNESYEATITRLYAVVFRQSLIVPTKAYVMELNGRRYFYMLRSRFGMDLKVGDKISFMTSDKNPYEIVAINGYDVSGGTEDASQGENPSGMGYILTSDPIEATVYGLFSMKVKYTLPQLVDMVFIATTDGNLIYIKREKLNIDLIPGDRIVYSVYTLVPNSVVELKRLTRR